MEVVNTLFLAFLLAVPEHQRQRGAVTMKIRTDDNPRLHPTLLSYRRRLRSVLFPATAVAAMFASWAVMHIKGDASLAVSSVTAGEDRKTPEDKPQAAKGEQPKLLASFTARILSIEMLLEDKKLKTPVVTVGGTVDVRYLIMINVVATEKAASPFDKKGPVALLTHSPALYFGMDYEERASLIGKEHRFKMYGFPNASGPPRYWHAEVEEKERPGTKTPSHRP